MAGEIYETTAAALWPAITADAGGYIPHLPNAASPAWILLDRTSEASFSMQLNSLLATLGTGSQPTSEGLTVDESKGKVYIDSDARIGAGVRIEGPCYIGPGAEVRHSAYIRGDVWACTYSVIGHASEVKHALLLPAAKAPHFNYVGDSILGHGVNLGAGCKLSNLRNDGKDILVRIPGEEPIGTGLRKFGALLADGVQLGCNVVTNPGVIMASGSGAWPNCTINGCISVGQIIKE
jgi:NDP-sugar pyrophosphorylase family protein